MKKSLLALPVILGIIVLISVPSVTAQSESKEIPSWIKGVANFWIDGGIDDAEFIEALEFLIDSNVIKLGNTEYSVSEVSLLKLEKEHELDLNVQLKKHVLEKVEIGKQHETIYNEKNAKYEKLKIKFDGIEAEWKQTYREMAIKIDKLEKEIVELK